MSIKEEIQALFITELVNTDEYKLVQSLTRFIKDEILFPSVKQYVTFQYGCSLDDVQQGIFSMCCLTEYGFEPITVTESYCVIDMKNFLL